MPESPEDPETNPRAIDGLPPPRPIRIRSFVLFCLAAGSLLTLLSVAANGLSMVCGWVQFLALLLVAAIVLTYYDGIVNRRRSGSP